MAEAREAFNGTYGSVEFAFLDTGNLEVTIIGPHIRIRIRESFDPRSWITAFNLLNGHGFEFMDEGAVRVETVRLDEFVLLEAQSSPRTKPGCPLKVVLTIGTAKRIIRWLEDNAFQQV